MSSQDIPPGNASNVNPPGVALQHPTLSPLVKIYPIANTDPSVLPPQGPIGQAPSYVSTLSMNSESPLWHMRKLMS